MTHRHRMLLKVCRTLHIYTTLMGLLLILFFAVTGFVLNHDDWFNFQEVSTQNAKALVPTRYLVETDKLAVVEFLRAQCDASGAVDSFDDEEDVLKVTFKSPGRQTEAVIKRQTGEAEILHETRGLLGRLTDLHRGKSSGTVWSLVIDGTCLLLLGVAATGLILWTSLRTRQFWGWTALILGLVLFTAIYFLAIP